MELSFLRMLKPVRNLTCVCILELTLIPTPSGATSEDYPRLVCLIPVLAIVQLIMKGLEP